MCTVCRCDVQESSEEKTQQLKERLSRLFEANERRCSRRVLYGSDLLQACTLSSEPGHSALTAGGWRWVGRESCLRAQRTCVATASPLRSTLLSVEDRLEAANSLIKRYFSSVYENLLYSKLHVLFENILEYLKNTKICAMWLYVAH